MPLKFHPEPVANNIIGVEEDPDPVAPEEEIVNPDVDVNSISKRIVGKDNIARNYVLRADNVRVPDSAVDLNQLSTVDKDAIFKQAEVLSNYPSNSFEYSVKWMPQVYSVDFNFCNAVMKLVRTATNRVLYFFTMNVHGGMIEITDLVFADMVKVKI